MPTEKNALGKEDAVRLALSYPFDLPRQSYLLTQDGAASLPHDFDRQGLLPVLACGSNQASQQLTRKFNGMLEGTPIPVTKAELTGFDVVYSAHFSSYGSIPATLVEAPDTRVTLAITWLTENQLKRMHETEALGLNYDFGLLKDIDLTLENGTALTAVQTYVSKRGVLLDQNAPIPLAEISGTRRPWKALSQAEVQEFTRHLLSSENKLRDFVYENKDNPAKRKERNTALKGFSRPFQSERYQSLC